MPKVGIQANREGIEVAKCTARRLMRELGLRGTTRSRAFNETTKADQTLPGPPSSYKRSAVNEMNSVAATRPAAACARP